MSTDTEWVKARRSGGNGGQCVEVRRHGGMIQIRDSKAAVGAAVLTFTVPEFDAFFDGAKGHRFDRLVDD